VSWGVELARDAKRSLTDFLHRSKSASLERSCRWKPILFRSAARNSRIAMAGAFASAIIESFTSQIKLRARLSSALLGTDETSTDE